MSEDVFGKREELIRIWESERRTRDLNATLMWENMKYFSGLFGGLLVAHTALVTFIWTNNQGTFPIELIQMMIAFPIAIIGISCCAFIDIRRRWSKFLLVGTQLLKLEDLLGLQQDITKRLNSWHKDKYLFQEYTENLTKYTSSEEFKKPKFVRWNSYTLMSIIYFIMIALGGYLLYIDIPLLLR